MSVLNEFHVIGRVVRKQEFAKDKGTSVLITLAMDRPGAKEGAQQADFAEFQGFIRNDKPTKLYDYVHEKDLIAVDGEIHSYKDKDNHSQISLAINHIGFLEKYKNKQTVQKQPA